MGGWMVALAAVTALALFARYHLSRWKTFKTELNRVSGQLGERSAELEQTRASLDQLAGLDRLTSLPNARGMHEFLRTEWRRALRDSTSISVIIVDIDHFSAYNNHLGREAGDTCLTKVSQAVRAAAQRPGDFVARYGGEEFGGVLPQTDQTGAFRVAQKLEAAMERMDLPHPDSPVSGRVTVSIGLVTATPAVDSSWEELELIPIAQGAMVGAKRAGRNRIVSANDD